VLELKAARPAFTVGFKVPANPGGVPAARAADEVASTGPAELRSKSEDEWKAVFVANAEEDGMIQEDDIAPALSMLFNVWITLPLCAKLLRGRELGTPVTESEFSHIARKFEDTLPDRSFVVPEMTFVAFASDAPLGVMFTCDDYGRVDLPIINQVVGAASEVRTLITRLLRRVGR
jgi:hypothetical protein